MANFTSTIISGIIDEITLASGSNYFSGTSGNYLSAPSNAAFQFSAGDFTVETWIYVNSLAGQNTITDFRPTNTNGAYILFAVKTTGVLIFAVSSADRITSSTGAIVINTWNHVAVSRSGTSTRMFINGVQAGSTYTDTTNYLLSGLRIGQSSFTSFPENFNGYMSNLRIVKGTALYTTNFTPPRSTLSAVTNTSLLLSVQPNEPFKDNSTNNFAITIVGTPTFNNVGPFNPAPPSTGTSQNIPMRQFRDGTIMISGFYDEVGDFTSAPSYAAGLYKTTYNGYFSDTPTWFATATPTTFGANPATSVQTTIIQEPATDDGTNFSVQWLGYFLPATTETYTFYTSSDDGSFMWIGANALSGFTTGNATVSNGGAHAQTEASGTAALTAGVYYPIRIQFGEIGGGDVMSFNFSTATITKTTNVTGRVFYNPATNGF